MLLSLPPLIPWESVPVRAVGEENLDWLTKTVRRHTQRHWHQWLKKVKHQ